MSDGKKPHPLWLRLLVAIPVGLLLSAIGVATGGDFLGLYGSIGLAVLLFGLTVSAAIKMKRVGDVFEILSGL